MALVFSVVGIAVKSIPFLFWYHRLNILKEYEESDDTWCSSLLTTMSATLKPNMIRWYTAAEPERPFPDRRIRNMTRAEAAEEIGVPIRAALFANN